jgi:hypothetical protein
MIFSKLIQSWNRPRRGIIKGSPVKKKKKLSLKQAVKAHRAVRR